MEYIESKDAVLIYSKKIGMSTIVNKLADLSGEQVSGFFYTRKIRLPRKLNVMALVGALNDRIKELNSLSLSKDAFEKLQYYPEFTEYQLQVLFEKVGTEEDFLKYRRYLWTLIIRNYDSLQLMDGEAQYLLNVRKQKIDSVSAYFTRINSCSMDLDKEFDGCPIINMENLLKNSFSQEEIRNLGKKYDIVIPNRLKKDELNNYVKLIMKSRKKLTKALETEIDGMTVVQLNSFCQLQQILLSATLKKEELVYLFLFLIHQSEFETLNLPFLIDYDFSKPLEFKVDLSVVDAFGRGEPKKVIYYDEPEEEPEEPEEVEEKPDTIIPATVEGMDVLIDLEKGTVTPQPKPEEAPVEEPIEAEEDSEEESVEADEVEEPTEEESVEVDEVEEPIEEAEEEPEEESVEADEVEEPTEEAEEEPEEESVEADEVEEPTEEAEEEPEEESVEADEVEEPTEEAEEEPEEESVEADEVEEPTEEAEEEPEEDDSDELDDLSDLDDGDDDIDDDRLDELVNIDEEDLSEQDVEENSSLQEDAEEDSAEPDEEQEVPNESYDKDFVAENEKESELIQEDGIENPYFGSKKLAPKKKQLITTLVVAGVIVSVLVALALVIHFLG